MEIRVWIFKITGIAGIHAGGTKLERFLHKNQHTQRKLLNWYSSMKKKRKIRMIFDIEN